MPRYPLSVIAAALVGAAALFCGPARAQLDPGTPTASGIGSVTLPNLEAGLVPGAAPSKMIVGGALFNNTLPTLTDGQAAALQSDNKGSLNVSIRTGTGAANNYGATGDAFAGGPSLAFQTYNLGFNGSTWDRLRVLGSTGPLSVGVGATANTAAGITPAVSTSAEATRVLKASAGNLYSVYATNLTATAGFLVVLNATSAPGDGAIAPLACVPLPASGTASINFNPGPAAVYSTGITVVLTSAATCFTKTTGTITGFISGSVS